MLALSRERGAITLTFRCGPIGVAVALGHIPTITGR